MPSGRPKGVKNKKYTYQFKIKVMKDYFDKHLPETQIKEKYSISNGTFNLWKRNYLNGILETGKKRKGNIFSALSTSKKLTNEERLELENMKLRIENERLKKGYQVKGGGTNKEYVSIYDANMKLSKN